MYLYEIFFTKLILPNLFLDIQFNFHRHLLNFFKFFATEKNVKFKLIF